MQVLLDQDVKKLGYIGDIVNVKPGYFRNYLQPRGLAQLATAKLITLAEARNKKRLLQKEQLLKEAKKVLEKLKDFSVTVKAKVSKKGKLYGSITEVEVINAIQDALNIKLEKEFIKMEHIKELGEHKITINLGKDLGKEITVIVEAA